jgi:hypothetical protein
MPRKPRDRFGAVAKGQPMDIWLDPQNVQKVAMKATRPDGWQCSMVFMSGVAVFNYKGTGGSWRRDRLLIRTPVVWGMAPEFPTPGFTIDDTPQRILTASLASISNSNEAIQAGWATDATSTSMERIPRTNTGRIIIAIDLAVRDSDGFIHRVAWDMKVLGTIKDWNQ